MQYWLGMFLKLRTILNTSTLLAVFASSLALSVNAKAVSISLGDKTIEIPEPNNFTLVTPEMSEPWEMAKHLIPPGNNIYATFITDNDAIRAKAGEYPLYDKIIQIQAEKQAEYFKTTITDFENLKKVYRREINNNTSSDEDIISKTEEDVSTKLSDSLGIDVQLTVSDIVLLPIHLDTDNILSFSQYVKYTGTSEGKKISDIAAITITLVHVRSKVIIIYIATPQHELEWSQKTSKDLAKAILTTNAKPFQQNINNTTKPLIVGPYTEIQVLIGIIIAVLFLILIWAIISFIKKLYKND